MKHFIWLKFLIIVLLAIGITQCSKSYPLHPTYSELINKGYYVYVLPEHEIRNREWTETVSIWSWDRHCHGTEISETANPIYVIYKDNTHQVKFQLTIGLWNMTWNHNQTKNQTQLDTQWASTGTAEYYTIDNYTKLRFEDKLGILVQVGSQMPITEVISITNELRYIGPFSDTITNPWDYTKCPK